MDADRNVPSAASVSEAICPKCGDGIDPEANGCCGVCGWRPDRIEVEGDKPKVEPTRHYFKATIAGLMTAREYLIDIEGELHRSNRQRDILWDAIEHVVNDSPGTPLSVKDYLRTALGDAGESL